MGIYLYLAPTLPDVDQLKDTDLQTPLRIYTADGKLISEFGEKRRSPVDFEDVPEQFINALLASEDSGYFQHMGIDLKGLTRAAFELIKTGKKKSGGSTITMQVAKNYYLSSRKTFARKFTEILLALKIERSLSKEEILELYLNKIYLGKRAYGIEAAAQVYYGKSVNELNLPQLAMIAGLPKAPSTSNPINNPQRAISRRNYVLARMRTLEMITLEEFDQAARAPVTARYHGLLSEVRAPHIAELVRRHMVERFGDKAYADGYRVYTTLASHRQTAANDALQRGLLKYDRDHGWRSKALPPSPLERLELAFDPDETLTDLMTQADSSYDIDWPSTQQEWDKALRQYESTGLLSAAVVADVNDSGAWVYQPGRWQWLPMERIEWAKPYINVDVIGDPLTSATQVLSLGQVIWIESTEEGPALAQQPEAEGALVSLRPDDGAIQALVGGFSYTNNKFNRVIQAGRQPGSAFKPFIYSAALNHGFTPASIINDAPVVFKDASLENTWRPQNHSGKFYGPTRLREALYRSQNLVSIRILKQTGPEKAIDYITPFGFPKEKLNKDLSLALGASAVTPMELATGYAALANGGFAIKPYYIERIENDDGDVLFEADPDIACSTTCLQEKTAASDSETTTTQNQRTQYAPRVMDERTNFLMISMLQDVVRRGTGQRALALNRNDLAGKTGTTNDQKDAWFSGFNHDLVTTVWVGFDQPRTLGRWAYGSNTALPIWVDYMGKALVNVPEKPFVQPVGVVSVRIDKETGLLADPGQDNSIFEYFREENVPKQKAKSPVYTDMPGNPGEEAEDFTPEQLF